MTEFKGPSGVFVEHVAQGGLSVDQRMFDVETMDAVFHALEACDVVFVVANDERFPLPKGCLFFGVNLDVLRWRHGVLPLVGRFIILTCRDEGRHPAERCHAVKWQGS